MRTPVPPQVLWLATLVVAGLALAGSSTDRAPMLPEGTVLVAALEHSISTVDARPGDEVELRTVHPVRLPDGGEVPVGAIIRGEVMHVQTGRGRRTPELLLRFTTIDITHDRYAIAAVSFHVRGRRPVRPGSARTRGPAGVALGTGGAVATDGRELVLPAGRRLSVRLTAPAVVRYRLMGDPRQVD
jgi:hypothetical protein